MFKKINISNNDSINLEFIGNIKKKNKIILISPGLTTTKIDALLSSIIDFYLNKNYVICIYWKCGTKKKNETFNPFGNIDHFNKAINKLIYYEYENIFLLAYSAGSYVVHKYLSTKQLNTNVKAAVFISGTPNITYNLKTLSTFWKKRLNTKITNITNKLNKYPKFNINNSTYSIINNISRINKNSNFIDYLIEKDNYPIETLINTIKIPSIIINAIDDPLINEFRDKNYNYNIYKSNQNVNFLLTKNGRHCIFLKRKGLIFHVGYLSNHISYYFFEKYIQ